MKYKVLAICSVLALQACGGDNGLPLEEPSFAGVSTGASSSNGGQNSAQSIVGTWIYTHSGSLCQDVYRFSQGGTFRLESLDAVSTGTYTFNQLQSNPSRYQLRMDFVADNGEADCLGYSDDDAGDTEVRYVEFGTGQLELYQSATSTSIFRILRRG